MNSICYQELSGMYLKQEWIDRLSSTLFLSKCKNGEITKAELHTFLKQQQIYSKHFTRYLAALLSNIEDHKDRFHLTGNLFDEMGLGEAGDIPHSEIYQNMMTKMGVSPAETILPSTQHLIDSMFYCCKSNQMVGLGALCLGAEGIVSHIYRMILNGLLSIGESLENLAFFTLHIECDDGHAETMYRIIDRICQENPRAMIDLNYGAEKLIDARVTFFEGLLK